MPQPQMLPETNAGVITAPLQTPTMPNELRAVALAADEAAGLPPAAADLEASSSRERETENFYSRIMHSRVSRAIAITNTVESALKLDAELLRACSVVDVMRGFGAVLATSKGTEATFALSAPVDEIDVFISHNWSTPRWQKWLTLAVHYNMLDAAVATLPLCCTVAVLCSLGVLPKFGLYGGSSGFESLLCSLVGIVSLLGMLFVTHDIKAFTGCGRRSTCFLDKLCIHQVDLDKMNRGIAGLAAFLCKSDTMLVIYTPVYLQRLWTVYELATALILKPDMRVTVVHVKVCGIILAGNFVFVLGSLLQASLGVKSWQSETLTSAQQHTLLGSLLYMFVPEVLWTFVSRRWAKTLGMIDKDVRSFGVRSAVCAVESDRALVQENVIAFMFHMGLVQTWMTSEEDVFDEFDELVHETLPPKLRASAGRNGVPYRVAVFIFFPGIFFPIFDFCVEVTVNGRSTGPVYAVAVWALFRVLLLFCYGPLALALAFRMTQLHLDLRDAQEAVFVCSVCLLAGSIAGAGFFGLHRFFELVEENPPYLVFAALFSLASVPLTYRIFGQRYQV
eukprot:NODE_4488_length_1884_cov_30.117814.p1 GENE.NODE_4488_length_1884_cov_30.117814~~NODE_4488_length_1884_cov_30.117814.p1  ORF type:complete len:616 (+),score=121.56 NODE_4488_length_1884_cov_30.117814:157-1848(+)